MNKLGVSPPEALRTSPSSSVRGDTLCSLVLVPLYSLHHQDEEGSSYGEFVLLSLCSLCLDTCVALYLCEWPLFVWQDQGHISKGPHPALWISRHALSLPPLSIFLQSPGLLVQTICCMLLLFIYKSANRLLERDLREPAFAEPHTWERKASSTD